MCPKFCLLGRCGQNFVYLADVPKVFFTWQMCPIFCLLGRCAQPKQQEDRRPTSLSHLCHPSSFDALLEIARKVTTSGKISLKSLRMSTHCFQSMTSAGSIASDNQRAGQNTFKTCVATGRLHLIGGSSYGTMARPAI